MHWRRSIHLSTVKPPDYFYSSAAPRDDLAGGAMVSDGLCRFNFARNRPDSKSSRTEVTEHS